MAGHPPSGTVTFLLTDLEGSTRMWEENPEAMRTAMVRHDELLEKTVAANDGFVFSRMGDGMAAAFPTARDAVSAAIAIKDALADENWRTASPLRTRIGLHTAEAQIIDDGGYSSLPINRCARLMSAAHGGQVVLSGATEVLARDQLADGLTLVDLGEHRLRDLGRPLQVFQVSRMAEEEDFPPLRSLDAFPGNLPAQASSFIGRQAETTRIAAALGTSRVVTITGVGGVGKTRSAIQVAADLIPNYRDGAWLVELAPVRDPNDVVSAVASTFRLSNRAGQTLGETLVEMLSNKQLLLVLDNCEHVVAAVARLVGRIERDCPDVVVLATSREGLAVEGEQLIALPPLHIGGPDDDLARLVATDAVRLFVERGKQVKADFALTESNSPAVVEICRRLDGVPLAIELAAARVIALSPAELAQRLDHRFKVLAGGRRGAVERHATLRAAIDWSYELLDSTEQRLLARIAVFSGGCTLDGIEEVCSGDPVEREDVIDVITGLVARSLVVAEDSTLGTRFRLLETIRQYGEERLADWNETDALLNRHAAYFADLLAKAAEHIHGSDQLVWARLINIEGDNIRAALATAIDANDARLAVQLVASHPHHHGYGGMGEVFEIPAERVVALPDSQNEPGYPRVLIAAAWHAYLRGDYALATELQRRALAVDSARPSTVRHPPVELDSCNLTAMAALASGDYAGAVAAYRRGAELAQASDYSGLAAISLAVGVNAALLGGADATETNAIAEEALVLARRSGMHAAIVISLNSLALTIADSDPQRARTLLEESVERSGSPWEASPSGILTACLVAGRLSDWDLTLRLAARSMHLERWIMAPLQVAPCLSMCARALAETRPELAGVLCGAAYAVFRRAASETMGDEQRSAATVGTNANFVLRALHEAGDIVGAAVGNARARELRSEGKAMSMDEAITYALASIEP
jgi:predicted ATPase/class 3 adenylate cyclase